MCFYALWQSSGDIKLAILSAVLKRLNELDCALFDVVSASHERVFVRGSSQAYYDVAPRDHVWRIYIVILKKQRLSNMYHHLAYKLSLYKLLIDVALRCLRREDVACDAVEPSVRSSENEHSGGF